MDGFKTTIYYILTHVNCQVSDDGCVNYRNSVIWRFSKTGHQSPVTEHQAINDN